MSGNQPMADTACVPMLHTCPCEPDAWGHAERVTPVAVPDVSHL